MLKFSFWCDSVKPNHVQFYCNFCNFSLKMFLKIFCDQLIVSFLNDITVYTELK